MIDNYVSNFIVIAAFIIWANLLNATILIHIGYECVHLRIIAWLMIVVY